MKTRNHIMKTGLILLALSALLLSAWGSGARCQEHRTGLLPEAAPASWMLAAPAFSRVDGLDQSCDNSAHLPPIGNQGSQGSCTAWAVGYYLKTYQEWEEHGWSVTQTSHQFSPAFVYNQINGGADAGSYMSDAFKLLCDLGAASLADMAYSQYNCTNWPEEADYLNGINHRCDNSYYITLNSGGLSTLKNYLLAGHVAVMGISVYSNFDNISSFNNTYCVSQVYGSNRGGHAVTLCGFDDEMVTADGVGAFKLANSWGTGWGASGYFWMSYEAVMSSTTSQGYAYYSSDKVGYSPVFLARFHVTHWDRHAVRYSFGIGNYASPAWSKDFFNWIMTPNAALTYPATNIVVDLSDGQSTLDPGAPNQVYQRCQDSRPYNTYAGSLTYFMAQQLNWPATSTSSSTPVSIPDNGSYVYATLTLTAPNPDIELSATDLDFDSVSVGSSSDLPLTIYNIGTDTLVINDITSGDPCFTTDFDPLDNLVPPADSLILTVTFAPTTAISYSTALNIENNDEPVGVNLQGVGRAVPAPQIVVSPAQLDFGSVLVGSQTSLPLTISNTGNEMLVIYSVSCAEACFTTDYDPADSLIAAGDSLVVTVSFAPALAQDYDANLLIANNDQPLDVPLTGYGTPPPAPHITLSADVIVFGEVLVGEQRELPLSICNIGEADLIIYDVSASEACFSTNFDPADSLLAPGDSLNISVIFAPSFAGNIEGLLTVENNDQPAGVLLIGCGLTPSAYNPDPSAPPLSFALLDPYPTPFNAQTAISYQLPIASPVNLKVYDLTGRMVAELVNGLRDAGVHQVTWDASGMPSGLYFCRIEAGGFRDVIKMMLVK